MIFGIISDTHDRPASIDAALDLLSSHGVERLLHAGDWTREAAARHVFEHALRRRIAVEGVLGNNDVTDAPALRELGLVEGVLELDIDGRRVAVYHGHHKPTLAALLAGGQYDVVVRGHSHKPLIETAGCTLVVNPGSTAFGIPRSKAWRPTVALLDTATLSARILEVPEHS